MRLGPWLAGIAGAGLGILAYGALVESKRLVLERRRLRLPGWPERLNGLRIAVLADLHLRDRYTLELAERAVGLALDQDPDVVVLPGDLVGYWKPESAELLLRALEPLLLLQGRAIAIPGNHEYWGGDATLLEPILDELNVRLLRNESWTHQGIRWVGVDSANAGQADPVRAMGEGGAFPTIVLWHEPDVVDLLPRGAALMIAGHSHGGQFRLPSGWAPMHTVNGRKYRDGFFPDAPTPLYVSRGIGTTGPPSRLFCPPEVSLLELYAGP